MTRTQVLSVDVGSTFTKGALFEVDGRKGSVAGLACVPTTTDHLPRGVARVLRSLCPGRLGQIDDDLGGAELDMPAFLSCSAKGGLRVAAVGLVPELTVDVARQAVCSAGGKVTAAFSYELTPDDLAALRADPPDIVLLAGGTDGGNSAYVRRNAHGLAGADLPSTVVYAGNRAVAHELEPLFAPGRLVITRNLMPDYGRLDLDPARNAIRDIFLGRIVEGKGLGRVARLFGAPPKPTPRAVLELVEGLAGTDPAFADLLLVDLGGATTDVYSNSEPVAGHGGVIVRGLPEPRIKRTVEGDLGLRVSASAVVSAGQDILGPALSSRGLTDGDLASHALAVSCEPGRLPAGPRELDLDRILASTCLSLAILRHAGSVEESWTPDGKVLLQRGKDLTSIRTLAGTGGFLARFDDASLYRHALSRPFDGDGRRALLPLSPSLVRDRDGLLPLLANLAQPFPEIVAPLASAALVTVSSTTEPVPELRACSRPLSQGA